MDGENKYWLSIFGLVSGVMCFVSVVVALHSASENRMITEMVKKGSSPIEAACAFDSTVDGKAICTLIASKKTQ